MGGRNEAVSRGNGTLFRARTWKSRLNRAFLMCATSLSIRAMDCLFVCRFSLCLVRSAIRFCLSWLSLRIRRLAGGGGVDMMSRRKEIEYTDSGAIIGLKKSGRRRPPALSYWAVRGSIILRARQAFACAWQYGLDSHAFYQTVTRFPSHHVSR